MTSKQELKRQANLEKSRQLTELRWRDSQLEAMGMKEQVELWLKTIKTLTAELVRKDKERDEFIRRLLESSFPTRATIEGLAKEVFK